MTHQAKFCVERPRKVGAKYTQKDLGKDEYIEEIQLTYESKRDRWNGYDPSSYKFVVDEWEHMNEEQQKKKAQEMEEKLQNGTLDQADSDSDSDDDPDIERNADEGQFANKDPRVRTTIRNLRIREDTAKYLRNLDPTSAPYDGKSRTMKENPNPSLPENLQAFKGDNFVKVTGDYVKMMNQENFMSEAA